MKFSVSSLIPTVGLLIRGVSTLAALGLAPLVMRADAPPAITLTSATVVASSVTAPNAVAFDAAGDMFVSVDGVSSLLKYTPGSQTPTPFGPAAAYSSVTYANGLLYASLTDSSGAHVVQLGNGSQYTSTTTLTTRSDATAYGGLAVDSAGSIYFAVRPPVVVDDTPGELYKATAPNYTSTLLKSDLGEVDGIAVAPGGEYLYTSWATNGPNSSTRGPLGLLIIGQPTGVIRDSAGNIYFCDEQESRVYVIQVGVPEAYIVATANEGLSAPKGLGFDSSGNLYVASKLTNSIFKLTLTSVPSVASVAPAVIGTSGGSVTVNGSFFTGASVVTIGGNNVPSSSFTANSASSITFPAPALTTGVKDITVTNDAGTSAITLADQITYQDAPVVSGISPVIAPLAGGTSLTISGSNFTGATVVQVGGQNIPASSFGSNSDSTIVVTVPAGTAGTVDVRVKTAAGTSTTTAADQLTYQAAPSITGVSTPFAYAGGGTAFTLTGTHFNGATLVHFGDQNVPSSNFTISGNTIQFFAPASDQGTGLVDLSVVTPAGTSTLSSADQVTYVDEPSVTGVSPVVASTSGGTTLTITGANFDGTSIVTIGGQNLPSNSFTINNSSTIVVPSSPALASGVVDITVTNPVDTSATSDADQITIEGLPTVTSVSPVAVQAALFNPTFRQAAININTPTVTITGTNFTGATSVTIGGTGANIRSISSTSITIFVPLKTAGTYDVVVTTPLGSNSTTASDHLTYEFPPTVTSLNVTQGVASGGTAVTITGTNFIGASSVSFGSNSPATSFTVNSATTIFATAPAHALGLVDVTVTTPVSTSTTSSVDQFTFFNPTPVINGATTATGAVNQAFRYQIAATNGASNYTATGLPAGLAINMNTGLITGTPTAFGTFTVTVTAANSTATATSTVTFTITGLTQAVNFPGDGTSVKVGSKLNLTATASSGLPITYKIVSGGAFGTLSSNGFISSVTPTAAQQTIVIEADQAGNGSYAPASAQIKIVTILAAPTVYTGSLNSAGTTATNLRVPAVSTTTVAATVSSDGTTGTLIGFLPSINAGFVANFSVGSDGTFTVTTPSLVASPAVSQSLTISGTVSGTAVSGTIAPIGATFSLGAEPTTGPSAAVSGFYSGTTLQSSTGGTYSIVGTQNDVVVISVSPTLVSAGTGTVTNNTFTVTGTGAATITGTLNPATTSLTGSVSTPTGGTSSYSGVASTTAPAVRLINLSTRGTVTPSSPLTAGFVIGGTTNKTVLLRGIGQSLTSFGLTGLLAHPTLTLMTQSGTVVATNTAWGGASSLSTTMAATGAFALSATSTDSVLVNTLAPGNYTVRVSDGVADAGGLALVEVFDATVDLSGASQKLVNISSIGTAGVGVNALVAGFVVSGNTPKQVLIRGVGPSLAAFNVSSTIADPVLVIYDNTGAMVAQNNDWGTPIQVGLNQVTATAAQLTAAATQVNAFALTTGSKDAALLVTLAPGSYTAQVTSGTTTAGTALVEVYEVTP